MYNSFVSSLSPVKLIILFLFVGVLGLTVFYLTQKIQKNSYLTLKVDVVQLIDISPVTGASVELLKVSGNGRSNVFARASLGNDGRAVLKAPAGNYVVDMVSGYAGREEIKLGKDTEVILKVIPVLQ